MADVDAVPESVAVKGRSGLLAAPLLKIAMDAPVPHLRLESVKGHDACAAGESVGIEVELDAAVLRFRDFNAEGLTGPIALASWLNGSPGDGAFGGCPPAYGRKSSFATVLSVESSSTA